MEIVVRKQGDIHRAYAKYYSSLADHFKQELGPRKFRTILEAGCGKGQLTIPLLKKLPTAVQMIAVDSSRGPYSGWLDELPRRLKDSELENRVQILESEVYRIRKLKARTVNAVVSNELLCDLVPRTRLVKALREFWRILQPGGIMIHGEWASHTDTRPQSLLIKHWPSWNPDQLHSTMQRCGFHNVQVTYFGLTIRFMEEAAVEELRSWGASAGFVRMHRTLLKNEGFRLPFEHIVRCERL